MNQFVFNKTLSGRWYLDWPEYEYDQSDLEMVNGADAYLDMLSKGHTIVKLNVYTDGNEFNQNFKLLLKKQFKLENHECKQVDLLKLIKVSEEGAYYESCLYNELIYLCPITLLFYPDYPSVLYIEHIV